MSGKLITQIWLTDLTLVTSLARLLDLLGNLEAAGGGTRLQNKFTSTSHVISNSNLETPLMYRLDVTSRHSLSVNGWTDVVLVGDCTYDGVRLY